MQMKLTARLQPPIHPQPPPYLLPTHGLAALGQVLLAKLIPPEFVPQLACPPGVPEPPRPSPFQPVGGDLPVIREQAQGCGALFVLIEHLQRLPPSGLLPVVDLAQVQNGSLHRFATRHTPILDHAEIAVVLAVFPSVGGAQEHRQRQNARAASTRKEGRSSLNAFLQGQRCSQTTLGSLQPENRQLLRKSG